MTIENCAHGRDHQTGGSATHPIEPPWRTLAALLLLAGGEPASSSRLASARHDGPLGRVQLRFLGSFNKPGRLCRRSVSDLVKDLKILIAKSNVAAQ